MVKPVPLVKICSYKNQHENFVLTLIVERLHDLAGTASWPHLYGLQVWSFDCTLSPLDEVVQSCYVGLLSISIRE